MELAESEPAVMFLCPVVELVCVSDQDTGLSDLFRHCMQTPEGENHEKASVELKHLLPALLCTEHTKWQTF